MPKVSICIALYNLAPFVGETVESVLKQTHQDLELVITDDASTDGSPEIVERISDPRIRLKRLRRNHGATYATNDATARVTGEYVAQLGADDVFESHKLATQVAYMEKHPEVGAVFGFPRFIDDFGSPFLDKSHPHLQIAEQPNRSQAEWLRTFFSGNCLYGTTMLYRREVNEVVGYFDARLLQLPDLDWYIRLVSRFPIHVIQEPLTRVRIRSGAANISTPRSDSILRHYWELEKVFRRFEQIPLDLFVKAFEAELKEPVFTGRQLQQREAFWLLCFMSNQRAAQRYALDALYSALPEKGVDASLTLSSKELQEYAGRFDLSGLFSQK